MMDELESEWETKESSIGKLGWMMRLGRKLLVTGIVVSSAPIVIPSIMVVSAIGLVCSVPYGVLLVTYACTETLMSRLLPMPSPDVPLLLEYGKAFSGEELREGRIEFFDKGEYQEYGIENDGKGSVERVGEIVEEDNGELMNERLSGSFEEVEQINGLQVEQSIIEENRNEQPADDGRGDIEAVVPLGSEHVEEKEEVIRETSQSVENVDAPKKRRKKKSKSKGKGEQSITGSANEELENVAVDIANEELVRNSRGSLERNGEEGTSRDAAEGKQGVGKEQVDAGVIKSKGGEGTTSRKREQRLIEESLANQPVDDKVVESQPSSSYSVHQEASDSSELPVSIKALEADDIRSSTDNVIDAASDEAIQREERIWEQMNALRTIVGYKAARKETCKEELKALYLFTGIEPPASLKDTSCDLAEVDAKLGFLKSVVGVK